VVGIVAVARTSDGHVVLIRRGDTGTWGLPGGTLEWGETLRSALIRELDEEAGIEHAHIERVLGVWSDPSRDPRFHAVTVGVECRVHKPVKPPRNRLEIRDVCMFMPDQLPEQLAFGHEDIVRAAAAEGSTPAIVE